jgi:hypothetical protein
VVVLSAALVLLFGGLYIAISILYRMRHGQWLQRAGPFEVHLAEEGGGALAVNDNLMELYAEAVEENELLIAELAKRESRLKELDV